MKRYRPSAASRRTFLVLVCSLVFGVADASAEAASVPAFAMGFYLPVLREVPRKDVEVSFRFWLEELGRYANMPLAPVQFYDSMADLKRDADSGKINFVVATAMGLVQHFPSGALVDGLTGYKTLDDHLLFVVRKEAGIRSPADLAGKPLALLEGDELTDIFLETLLMQAAPRLEWRQLGVISRETRGSKLVHRLFFNNADAALIPRNAYEAALALNPQISARLQVLPQYSFKTRSTTLGLFTARTPPEERARFVKGAMSINETPRGRQILQIYQAATMGLTSVDDLDPFRELLASYRTLKSNSAKKGAGKQ